MLHRPVAACRFRSTSPLRSSAPIAQICRASAARLRSFGTKRRALASPAAALTLSVIAVRVNGTHTTHNSMHAPVPATTAAIAARAQTRGVHAICTVAGPGFSGDLCEFELLCATAKDGLASGFNPNGCDTSGMVSEGAEGPIVCTCNQLGFVAVVRFRYSLTSFDFDFAQVTAEGGWFYNSRWLLPWMVAYAVVIVSATMADQRWLYTASPPWWNQQPTSFLLQLRRAALSRTSWLRILFIPRHPCYSIYTRLQCAHVSVPRLQPMRRACDAM